MRNLVGTYALRVWDRWWGVGDCTVLGEVTRFESNRYWAGNSLVVPENCKFFETLEALEEFISDYSPTL